jgi:electron transport complex protein RnfA
VAFVAPQHQKAENCPPDFGFSWPFPGISYTFVFPALLAFAFHMSHYLFLLIGAVLVNNVVLVKILGLCPFMGVSKKLDTAYGMGAATTFVLTLATGASFVIDHYLLMPYGLGYLRTIAFIVTIAGIVQLTEMVIAKTSPVLQQVLGIYLPLITTNCAVLGVPLINVSHGYGFVESLLFGFGSAVGFTLVLILFAGMRERFEAGDVPKPFKGVAIAMVTAGLMSLAFMGFSGLDRY